MNESELHRQQALYWAEMVQLRVATSYIRRYHDYLAGWVTSLGTVRAVASCTSIAGWAIWKEYAFAWAVVIACSQVVDALQNVIPVAKRHKAASEHAMVLESLFIDAQLAWESIFAGKYTNEQIAKRLHTLRTLHHNAECRNFPDGLPSRGNLFGLAESEAKAFFMKMYGVNSVGGETSDESDKIAGGDNA